MNKVNANLKGMDHVGATRKFWRETVFPLCRYSTSRRLDLVLGCLMDAKSVIDLGCVEHNAAVEAKRDWWLHGLLAKKISDLVGVDYDQDEVSRLTQKGYNIICQNVETMRLGRYFDAAVAGELFEHLTNHRSFLEAVHRHLSNSGRLVLSVPNANSLNYFVQTLIFKHELDAWNHTTFFTPTTLCVMLQACGFRPIEIILYQPDEIYHHERLWFRLQALVFNRCQQLVCLANPFLARGLVVVAKKA